jgi:hypothetical protein
VDVHRSGAVDLESSGFEVAPEKVGNNPLGDNVVNQIVYQTVLVNGELLRYRPIKQ